MRKPALIAAALLGAAACLSAVPAIAQESENSGARSVLNRVLDSLLGPEKEAEEEAPPQEQATTPVPAVLTPAERMAQVLASPIRDKDRARDVYRHPAQTLDFFRIEPGMTVADFMPAGGWYSRVLIPYLGREGTYIGVDPWLNSRFGDYWDQYRDTPNRLPSQARDWVGYEGARVIGVTANKVPEQLQGTVDRFLIFREMHNIRRYDWLHETLTAARSLLKDDGMVGVVQHRAREGAPLGELLGDKGYQREADIIALFALYGFELVGRSNVNDNPTDPSNWEIGVWALPPSYVGLEEGDTARKAQLDAVGESDRMTLLFRKRA